MFERPIHSEREALNEAAIPQHFADSMVHVNDFAVHSMHGNRQFGLLSCVGKNNAGKIEGSRPCKIPWHSGLHNTKSNSGNTPGGLSQPIALPLSSGRLPKEVIDSRLQTFLYVMPPILLQCPIICPAGSYSAPCAV